MPELSTFGTRCSPLLASHSYGILFVYFGSWTCRRDWVLPRHQFFFSLSVHFCSSVLFLFFCFFFGSVHFFYGHAWIRPLLFMHASVFFFFFFFSRTWIRPLFFSLGSSTFFHGHASSVHFSFFFFFFFFFNGHAWIRMDPSTFVHACIRLFFFYIHAWIRPLFFFFGSVHFFSGTCFIRPFFFFWIASKYSLGIRYSKGEVTSAHQVSLVGWLSSKMCLFCGELVFRLAALLQFTATSLGLQGSLFFVSNHNTL